MDRIDALIALKDQHPAQRQALAGTGNLAQQPGQAIAGCGRWH
jgi:hypothetical protein